MKNSISPIGCMAYTLLFIYGMVFCAFGVPAFAENNQVVEGEVSYKVGDPRLDTLWISEKTGSSLPLDVSFQNEEGNTVTLAEIIDRPTILLPIYFFCPSACSANLANLARALSRTTFQPGKDFRVIALSFNEKENDENARIAKNNYLRLLPDDFPEKEWVFLTGNKEKIRKVTDSIGYTFKATEDQMFIHPSALVVVGEGGLIIKYVYGRFVPGDVDMAISEAQSGTPSLSVKRLLGFCLNYDPSESRSFFKNVKLAVLFCSGVFGIGFLLYLMRGGRKREKPQH